MTQTVRQNEVQIARRRNSGVRMVLGSVFAVSNKFSRVAHAGQDGGLTESGTVVVGGGALTNGVGDDQQAPIDLRYVALGAVCVAEDRLSDTAHAALGLARAMVRPAAAFWAPFVPESFRREWATAIKDLDAYGRYVANSGSEDAVEIVDALAIEIVQDPNFSRVLEQVLRSMEWSLLDSVLPKVFERLHFHSEEVQALVRDQSVSAAVEMANAARSKAEEGDQAVETLLARIFRRRPRSPQDPAPPVSHAPSALPSGA